MLPRHPRALSTRPTVSARRQGSRVCPQPTRSVMVPCAAAIATRSRSRSAQRSVAVSCPSRPWSSSTTVRRARVLHVAERHGRTLDDASLPTAAGQPVPSLDLGQIGALEHRVGAQGHVGQDRSEQPSVPESREPVQGRHQACGSAVTLLAGVTEQRHRTRLVQP